MKESTIKFSIFITILISLLIVTPRAHAQSVNFTGTWKRNNEKSNAGNYSLNSIPASVTIVQDAQHISIKRTSITSSGIVKSFIESIPLNGDSTKNEGLEKLIRTTAAKWGSDKRTLLIGSTSKDADGVLKQTSHQAFTLSADGKVLTIIAHPNYQDGLGEQTFTEVFDKQ